MTIGSVRERVGGMPWQCEQLTTNRGKDVSKAESGRLVYSRLIYREHQ
jgi:hypothetical protein